MLASFGHVILMSSHSAQRMHEEPDLLVYSLAAHKVVKKLSIPGIVSFSANSRVIVIVGHFPSLTALLRSVFLS